MTPSDQRERWATFICSLSSPGRYLLPGGHLRLEETAGGKDVDVESFFSRLDDKEVSVSLLGAAYFLSQPAVHAFIQSDLTQLLRGLSHGTVAAPRSVQRELKGRVDWGRTVRGRYSGKVPRGTHVVARSEKSADVPENQLLKLFLKVVDQRLRELIRHFKGGQLPRSFEILQRETSQALQSAYLTDVTSISVADARMHAKARSRKNKAYGDLSRLQEQLWSIVQQSEWGAIANLLRRGWLAPIDHDRLFELYTLILTLDVLERELGMGEPVRYGLIQSRRKEVAQFEITDQQLTARVYFNQAPAKIFSINSEYIDIFRHYDGVSQGKERRPDIAIQFSKATDNYQRNILIEVKETDSGPYQRDSIYKALGYLYDFRTLWKSAQAQKPKAIMVFPEEVRLKPSASPDAELALVSAEDRERLAQLLRDVLR